MIIIIIIMIIIIIKVRYNPTSRSVMSFWFTYPKGSKFLLQYKWNPCHVRSLKQKLQLSDKLKRICNTNGYSKLRMRWRTVYRSKGDQYFLNADLEFRKVKFTTTPVGLERLSKPCSK
jgi:hypothetical protein